MDIFVEQLIKKEKGMKEYGIVVASIAAALALIYMMITVSIFRSFAFITFIVVCGLIYLLYLLVTSINLEYEYCFTNGSLDVDKIVNMRKRARMTELNARTIDLMASRSNSNFERYLNNSSFKKVYACNNKNSDDLYFVIYNEDGVGKMLLFNPNEKIKDGFKKFNPQNVEL